MAKVEIPIQVTIPVEDLIEYLKKDGNLVEVVRCKDCKYTRTDGCDAIYCEKWDYWEIPEDFYCAYGERKENA